MAKSEFLSIEKRTQKRQSKKVKKVKERLEKGELKNANTPKKSPNRRFRSRENRGVIYLGHLPHGFYEKEIKEYFKQFGDVTGIHVSRSEKTGRSKGFAFVEFQNADVAKIAAETMNNYLMKKKMLKAEVVPNEQVHRRLFRKKVNWTPFKHPSINKQKTNRLKHNKTVEATKCNQVLHTSVKKVNKMLEKLQKAGLQQDLEIVNKPESLPIKTTNKEEKIVLEIDPSDDEVEFNVPPGTLIKTLKKKRSSPSEKPAVPSKTTPKSENNVKVKKTIAKKSKLVAEASPKKVAKLKMGLKQAMQDKSSVKDKSNELKKKKNKK